MLISDTIINLSGSQINSKKTAINKISTPPKIRITIINWEKKITPIIRNIIFNIIPNNEKNTKTLFVNQIENISNETLNIERVTPNLIKILNTIKNNHIAIKSYIPYIQIYENLKLSNKNLSSRSTAIKLARYIHAHYILYSVIHKKSDIINLEIQLILVQNGEIIYSDVIPI